MARDAFKTPVIVQYGVGPKEKFASKKQEEAVVRGGAEHNDHIESLRDAVGRAIAPGATDASVGAVKVEEKAGARAKRGGEERGEQMRGGDVCGDCRIEPLVDPGPECPNPF
eukprot:scaffold3120_cov26-Tisochrysis_lutea.AAC.3